jgi:BirA family biotin operon repressor/biotin-[acetyl-CoA-carboxylase] ligase
MPKRIAAVPETTDRRIDQLLGLLTEHPMVVLSGAKIARQVGVSRTAVWRWVERLRALGVKIKGHPKSGYQLQTIPDILVPRVIQPALKGTQFGRRAHHFFKIHSTNGVALQLAGAGEAHGSLVIAEEQTAGRGRLGRAWHSEKTSGIYLSVILRPPFAPLHAPVITLAAGLAARDAVATATGHQPELRWPNDLLASSPRCRRRPSGCTTWWWASGSTSTTAACRVSWRRLPPRSGWRAGSATRA